MLALATWKTKVASPVGARLFESTSADVHASVRACVRAWFHTIVNRIQGLSLSHPVNVNLAIEFISHLLRDGDSLFSQANAIFLLFCYLRR